MNYQPRNTLAHYESLPQRQLVNMSDVPIAQVVGATKRYKEKCEQVVPEREAIEFYALNHCMSLVQKQFTRNESLAPWAQAVQDEYRSVLINQSERMFHYLLCIITREMRHLRKSEDSSDLLSLIAGTYGTSFKNFVSTIRTNGESEAVNKLLNHPPQISCAGYARGLAVIFNNGDWSSGYGGKAWGTVADCCASFLEGKISMEMLLDTAWTLAHNNGPIFNKGMMYSCYTGSQLQHILDVQRSGQVPEFVKSTPQYYTGYVDSKLKKLILDVGHFNLKVFGMEVDYQKVEDAGAIGNYSSQIQEQEFKVKLENVKIKSFNVPLPADGKVYGEPWTLFPGMTVQTYTRVKANG